MEECHQPPKHLIGIHQDYLILFLHFFLNMNQLNYKQRGSKSSCENFKHNQTCFILVEFPKKKSKNVHSRPHAALPPAQPVLCCSLVTAYRITQIVCRELSPPSQRSARVTLGRVPGYHGSHGVTAVEVLGCRAKRVDLETREPPATILGWKIKNEHLPTSQVNLITIFRMPSNHSSGDT